MGAPTKAADALTKFRLYSILFFKRVGGFLIDPGNPRLIKQRLDKLIRVEFGDVFGCFAQTHELDRNIQHILDGDDNTAAGRPIELGQKDARYIDRRGKQRCRR